MLIIFLYPIFPEITYIIIIIIINFYRIYAEFLQLYTWNNHMSRVSNFAAVLYLVFRVHVMFSPHDDGFILLR